MAYHGKQGKGAARLHREVKREEAEERNARTPLERTKRYRRNPEHAQMLARKAEAA